MAARILTACLSTVDPCREVRYSGTQCRSLQHLQFIVTFPFYSLSNVKFTASVVYWSQFLATDLEVRVRFTVLPDFLRSSGAGTGSTQPREYN
jgi:hypothetical protein